MRRRNQPCGHGQAAGSREYRDGDQNRGSMRLFCGRMHEGDFGSVRAQGCKGCCRISFQASRDFRRKPEELVGLVRMLGKRLIVSGMHGKQNYFDVDLSKDVAIVIGNEGNGCSRAVMTEADTVVSIPMRGKLESLNASIAAAVLMYESVRK